MMPRVEINAARRRTLPMLARYAAGLLAALLIVAVVASVGGAMWLKNAMRAQLPVLDGDLRLAGLSALSPCAATSTEYRTFRPLT